MFHPRRACVLLLLLLLLVARLLAAEAPRGGWQRAEHVIVVGVDGMSPAGIVAARTPVMDRLMFEGAFSLTARGVMPTNSSPNWASMIMGAGPEQHGVTGNGWRRERYRIPPTDVTPSGLFPTIFWVLRSQRPEAVIGVFHDWKDFERLVDEGVADVMRHTPGAGRTVEAAAAFIRERRPTLTFIHLDHVDRSGHRDGHGTRAYLGAVEEADRLIGRIAAAVAEAGIGERAVVLVTSDHGWSGTRHGGSSFEELRIPWIIQGSGIARGRPLTGAINTYDTAATIAYVLGLERPRAWIARPVVEAMEGEGGVVAGD